MLLHALRKNISQVAVALAVLGVAACGGEPKDRIFADTSAAAPLDEARIEAGNRTLVLQAFDAWAAGTGSPYDLLADSVSWTIVGKSAASRTYESREAFMSEVIRPFNARMSEDLKPTIRQLIAKGDTVVIFFDASGIARDARPYSNTYAWIWKMANGRVVEAYAFFDSIVFNELWTRVQPVSTANE